MIKSEIIFRSVRIGENCKKMGRSYDDYNQLPPSTSLIKIFHVRDRKCDWQASLRDLSDA